MPANSTPENYAAAVMDIIGDPLRYRDFVQSSRRRYEEVLNWEKWAESLLASLRSIDLNCDLFNMHSPDTSTAFFGYLCAIKAIDPTDRAERKFREIVGRGPDLAVSTPSYRACVALSAAEKVGEDEGGTVTVVLHGEIYEAVDNQAAWLAQRFAEHGFTWAREIHGSFALVAIDKARDRVAVITDRLNSRRLFASQIEGGVCISSHFSAQPSDSFDLDAAGVAWYITNRILGKSRTLLTGVSILKRACVHQLTPSGLDAAPYWLYSFGSTEKNRARRQMAGELKARLIQAVQRRLYDSPNVFLSLSAGLRCGRFAGDSRLQLARARSAMFFV